MFKIFLIGVLFRISLQTGFQKDLNVNIQFPPILDRRDGIPTGHLRPLGWQSRAEGPVKEESVMIEAEHFWNSYIESVTPVVLRGLVLGSDACEKWTDSYLMKEFGHLDIKLAERKQNLRNEKSQMKLKDFLEGFRLEDWYLNGIMPEEMQNEAPIPRLLNCGPFTFDKNSQNYNKIKEKIFNIFNETLDLDLEIPKMVQLVEPYFWLSAGETSSLIHSHPEHNLHCVLDGRKDFILIPNDQFVNPTKKYGQNQHKKKSDWRKELGLNENYLNSNEWYSKIDVDKVNAFKFKLLENMIWYYASLREGDCIYIPSNYLHQVRSHGRSLTTSIYFKTFNLKKTETKFYDQIKSEMFKQCSNNAPLFDKMSSVSENFVWVYSHSERHLNKKIFKPIDVRYYLHYLIKNESLFYENFENFHSEITREFPSKTNDFKSEIKELLSLKPMDLWSDLTTEKSLSIEKIFKIQDSNLKRLNQLLNIVSNYHGHESNYLARNDEL
ncbi:unnamed protein product [Brachionus calyciflorus]|uniref:JmjC domain-containing protein n=1 Tax=Brachionus calyciflorus TaxID=104777 RepID=A0A813M9N6_9BILA|nr:unnamed protein product [Brachionus calyciflorus]